METETIPDSQVDNDIANIRKQIDGLRHRRSLLSSALLSSRNTLTRLQRAKAASSDDTLSDALSKAISLAEKQTSSNLENVYRTCVGVTAFRVQDPDPYAVDDGKVLGIRIEVFVNGSFLQPYYILLHRPSPSSSALYIHKHTIPPCIPLQPLVSKHLPPSRAHSSQTVPDTAPSKPTRPQNLPRLVRALRRELVAHHKRLAAIETLRTGAGLSDEGARARGNDDGRDVISDVKALDASGREIEIRWGDGTAGRVVLGTDGRVERAVVRGPGNERRRDLEGRVEGLLRAVGGQGDADEGP